MANSVVRCARHMGRSVALLGWTAASAVMVSAVVPAVARAQAGNYAALQPPQASVRDYTAAVVGGGGTTFLFQWREGAGAGMHWQLDAGLSDPKGSADPRLILGGGLARELTGATATQPLALLFTAGVGASLGDGGTTVRVPVGVSIGHQFDLDGGMSITPFAHPRVSLDTCGRCVLLRTLPTTVETRGRTTASLNVDVGAVWQVHREFGVRAAATFTGSDVAGSDESVTVGVTWTPASLSGNRRR